MEHTLKSRWFALLAAALVNLPAAAQDEAEIGETAPAEAAQRGLPDAPTPRSKRECISVSRIRDYDLLDDRNMVVWAPNRRSPYHLKLGVGCTDLRNAGGLLFRASGIGQLCGGAGDYILTRDIFGAEDPFEQRCNVYEVNRLDEAALYELRVLYGRRPPPPPLPPAEVEVLEVPQQPRDTDSAGEPLTEH